MTTKQRFRNNKFRLEVRERDHGTAHVHLRGGFDVIIELETLATTANGARLRAEVLAWLPRIATN